jgi:hypothetical protein
MNKLLFNVLCKIKVLALRNKHNHKDDSIELKHAYKYKDISIYAFIFPEAIV